MSTRADRGDPADADWRRWTVVSGVRQFSVDIRESYLAAATAFIDVVERIGDAAWDGPGLGSWSLRELVGHTVSSGLQEVMDALDRPAGTIAITSPQRYYALAATVDPAVYASAVAASTEAARRIGRALGGRPARGVRDLVGAVERRLADVASVAVVTTAGGGMAVDTWMPTRTFELVVHSLDIAAVTGLSVDVPEEVVAEAAVLAVRIAAVVGDGTLVLRALTGRATLPDGFSVV